MDKVIIDGVDVSIPVKLRPNRTDLTGKKFGKLTVIKPVISAKIGQKAHSRWLCQCECGNYKVAYTFSLTSGNTQSCGCLVHKPNTYVKRLQQENERLKKQYNCYACDSCGGKEDYINMKRHTENAIKTVHKYSKVLQEIREELEEDITCESRECGCDDYGECLNCFKETILAKINEVIGAEE